MCDQGEATVSGQRFRPTCECDRRSCRRHLDLPYPEYQRQARLGPVLHEECVEAWLAGRLARIRRARRAA